MAFIAPVVIGEQIASHAASCDVRLCGVLRVVPDSQLVVLSAPQCVCEKPLSNTATFMSHFPDRLNYFRNPRESFSGEHGITTGEDRTWEDSYATDGLTTRSCARRTGSTAPARASWKIFVKGGIVHVGDPADRLPRTRWDMPNHEPRLRTRRELQLVFI